MPGTNKGQEYNSCPNCFALFLCVLCASVVGRLYIFQYFRIRSRVFLTPSI